MNIAFWSYKGGSGRSICAANLAVRLSENKRVGILDFDLEAPGMHTIFGFAPGEISKRGCLIDLFKSKSLVSLNSTVVDIAGRLKDAKKKERSLFLLPNIDDPVAIDKIDWNHADTIQMVSDLIIKFKQNYALDYVLIDTRSGFAAITAASLQCAQKVFLFFRPNIQHRAGILKALKIFNAQGVDYSIIASQVPEILAANKFVAESTTLFEKKIAFVLPLNPEFAVGEKLLLNTDGCFQISKIYDDMANSLLTGTI
jgi:MinD-like ATPase involved in chromosome partitioning or flagellar assembly